MIELGRQGVYKVLVFLWESYTGKAFFLLIKLPRNRSKRHFASQNLLSYSPCNSSNSNSYQVKWSPLFAQLHTSNSFRVFLVCKEILKPEINFLTSQIYGIRATLHVWDSMYYFVYCCNLIQRASILIERQCTFSKVFYYFTGIQLQSWHTFFF